MYEETYFKKEINRLFPKNKDEIIFIYEYTGDYLFNNKYKKYLYEQDPRKKNLIFYQLFLIIKNNFENKELIKYIHTKSLNILKNKF